MLITLLKSCFTPSKFWSHHLFFGSHLHNFVHTIKMLITLLKSCFTPSKFWSHHQFSRSHRHNFDHTMKMLITLLKNCFTPSKFWSHHLFSGSHLHDFVHTIKMLITLLKSCFTHLNFEHTINFQDHTVIIFITPLRVWNRFFAVWSQIKCKNHEYVVQNMQTSHRFPLLVW